MVRPERVEVTPVATPPDAAPPNALEGKVDVLTFRGAHTSVTVDCTELSVEAEVANVHGEPPPWLTVGSPVVVHLAPSALRVLAP